MNFLPSKLKTLHMFFDGGFVHRVSVCCEEIGVAGAITAQINNVYVLGQ